MVMISISTILPTFIPSLLLISAISLPPFPSHNQAASHSTEDLPHLQFEHHFRHSSGGGGRHSASSIHSVTHTGRDYLSCDTRRKITWVKTETKLISHFPEIEETFVNIILFIIGS